MLLFLPISLCSPVIPIMLVKLFSNYAENFLVDMYCTGLAVEMCLCENSPANVSFSMCAHALNGDPHVIIMFSRGERFESSLLFSLV